MDRTGLRGLISAALLIGAVLILQTTISTASIGARSTRSGPVYSAPDAIRFAQGILVADQILRPGSFEPGDRDRATIAALRTFQRRHYLRPTGLIDPETMGVLTSHGMTRIAAVPGEAKLEIAERMETPGEAAETIAEVVEEEESIAQPGDVTESEIEEPATEEEPVRAMPTTGSPTVLMLVLGGVLFAAGSLLLTRRHG
ncbi:MAG: peptidoglycan-binding domain-containing protein [Acidobacteria bacterium]|nr:peptidoglycan-binding domain-containing protein [Acidobacteriota bacterium]